MVLSCGTVNYAAQGIVLSFDTVDEIVTIQIIATKQYFPEVLFIILYKVRF